jgi:hypothetical protein
MDKMLFWGVASRAISEDSLLSTTHHNTCGSIFTDPLRDEALEWEGGTFAGFRDAWPCCSVVKKVDIYLPFISNILEQKVSHFSLQSTRQHFDILHVYVEFIR